MRTELIVCLIGFLCQISVGQEIQPEEITTEWITTDAPTSTVSAFDMTTVHPQIDSRARILLNSEFDDDPTRLTPSQTGIPSTGSSLDNSLKSGTNNDWTPIVWPATTRLPSVTPLPSPVATLPPSPVPTRLPLVTPSTLVIRPTPLLRPVPTIIAAPARVATLNTQRIVSSSVAVNPPPSSEAPILLNSPSVSSSRPDVVHFDLEDASSGPKLSVSVGQEPRPSIDPIRPTPVNSTRQVASPNDKTTNATLQTPAVTQNSTRNATAQLNELKQQLDILELGQSMNETRSLSALTNQTINSTETSTTSPVVANSTDFLDDPFDESANESGLGNSSSVILPSGLNDTLTEVPEGDILTTPLEDDSMTTDLSTTSNNATEDFDFGLFDDNNVTVLPTELPVPSSSQSIAAMTTVKTSPPLTTVTPHSTNHSQSNITTNDVPAIGKGNREESGRSTTLSTLTALSTLFPALKRQPSTTSLPTETSHSPTTTTTTRPTVSTTTMPPTTTRMMETSIKFPTSVWTVAPQQAPPTHHPVPHLISPQSSWPTTTHTSITYHHSSPSSEVHHPTEYYPSDGDWPSTEGSQSGGDQDSTSTIVAVSVSIAVFLCLAIGILLFLVVRRRRARAVQGTCQPARMDAYSLDNVSQSNTWQRGKVRNSLRASKRSYLNQAFDDSTVFSVPLTAAQLALYMEKPITSIEAEFRNIATSTVRIDELPVGVESKNRYANVLPVPETRVHIRVEDSQPADTIEQYINANYIKGPKEELNYYIASQGPMEETVQDFWQMIWENQCKIIIQLTDLSENGVTRCAEYLPPSEVLDCHRLYGDYQVTLKSRELRDNYVTSNIQLKRMEDNLVREVTHLWYSSWPATGVPPDGKTIIALLLEARKGQSKENKSPMVIHCSPGTGRTGAVLAIDVCMRNLDSTRSVDIPRCVHRLRQDRAGCVQTGEQYAFIYKAVNDYASQLSNAALDSL